MIEVGRKGLSTLLASNKNRIRRGTFGDGRIQGGTVRRLAMLLGLVLVFSLSAHSALAQKGCQLNIVGTWATPDQSNPTIYRFTEDGTVTALSAAGSQVNELREIGAASYVVDNPKAPKVVLLKELADRKKFPLGTTSLDITGYDDKSVTVKILGQDAVRWTRVDPNRYFMVLAGRIRQFYEGGGPSFPMLIKTDGRQTQIDAVGLFPKGGYWDFGKIPEQLYSQFMKETDTDSEVMFRLEITGVQYERALKIVQTWERRAREGALLYPDVTMSNILLAKGVTESLNQCGERIKLYKLDWGINDYISHSPQDKPETTKIPYLYFKTLRRLNESLHVGDEKFHAATRAGSPQSGH